MGGTGVRLEVLPQDLDAERGAVVAAGWGLHEDIVERAWGLRDFRLFDPDGHFLRITTR